MPKIHVEQHHMAILKDILQDHYGAYIFGSRVKGDHKKFSDLDICFIRDKKMDISEISKLNTAFEDSNLPFKVDIVDYNLCSDEFKAVIDKHKISFPY